MSKFLESIVPIIDIGSLYFLILGIVIIIFSGLISDVMGKGKSLIISIILTFLPIFISINHIVDVETMRIVVVVLIISCIVPYSITFLMLWVLTHNQIGFVRIGYVSFIGWWLSIFTIEILRFISGWGQLDSIIIIISILLFYSILTGILGSIIGKIILDILGSYRPEKPMHPN